MGVELPLSLCMFGIPLILHDKCDLASSNMVNYSLFQHQRFILFSTANDRCDLRVDGLVIFDRTEVKSLPWLLPWLKQDFNCFSAVVSNLECNEEKGARVKREGFTII